MLNYNLLKLRLLQKYPLLAKYLSINYGIDLSLIHEETKDTHYIFGISTNINKKIIMPDANWNSVAEKIDKERQSGRNIESMNCTNFGALTVIEMIILHKFNKKVNYSDRWSGIQSGTGINGNSPTRVLDTIRKKGLLPEEFLPNNTDKFSWKEYYSYKDATMSIEELEKEALKFLEEYTFGYETVYPSILAMKEALKISPLYVAGYAWAIKNGLYYSAGNPNHCFVITNIEQAVAYKDALDSYEPFMKKLGADYQVFWPKIIIINKKGEEFNLITLRNLIKRGIEYIQRPKSFGEVYKISLEGLEKKENPELTNDFIIKLRSEGKIIGVDEEYFNNEILI